MMKKLKMIFIFIFIALCYPMFLSFLSDSLISLSSLYLYADDEKAENLTLDDARKIFMLGSYISNDYQNAVRDGRVISEFEYREMLDFCSEILELSKGSSNLQKKSQSLCELIESKANYDEVKEIADEIVRYVIGKGAIVPTHIPNFESGKKLFSNFCSSCHGENGEGPKPDFVRNWTFPVLPPPLTSPHLSPVKVFIITELGIEGTPMPSFKFNEKERWDLAFYVSALKYLVEKKDEKEEDTKSYHNQVYGDGGTKKVLGIDDFFASAISSTEELESTLGYEKAKDMRLGVFDIDHVSIFLSGVEKVKSLLLEGKKEEAEMILTTSYLIFEEIEPQLKISSKSEVLFVEILYASALRKIKDGKTTSALSDIEKISDKIASLGKGFKFDKTLSAFVIVFREGFEAILIISAILGIVSLVGGKSFPIFLGAFAGLVSGIALWEVSGSIVKINRELMEGIFTLIAVFLIVWVSLWILEKSREESIRKFIQKTKEVAQSRRWLGIFFLSFVAVGRESGETVLFLRALGEGIEKGVVLGFLSLSVVIFLIYIARVKLRPKIFFISTNVILNLTAISLMGKAVVEFQEVGLIPVTLINIPSVDILGLFPTIQSLIPQLILAVFLFGSLFWRIFEGENKVDKKKKSSTENQKEKNEGFEDTKSLVRKTVVNK